MFDELNRKEVRLMLDLARENYDTSEAMRARLTSVNIDVLYKLCKEHELHGVVASHVLQNDLCELPLYWLDDYKREKNQLSFFKKKTEDICRLMNDNGIKMVVLKNGGIMSDIIDDAAACPMEDIDSLVKKCDFLKAHELLINNGLEFHFRSVYEKENLETAFHDGSTEYCIEMNADNKMWFELAWRAVAGRWIRQDLEPSTDELIDRSYFAKDTRIGILSPEDNLLQVSVHTAKHSYVRAPGLRLHLDVERIVSHKTIDWDLFIKKVSDAHVKTSTYFSLYFAKMLFGTEIPEWVLEKLKPSKTKTIRILRMISNAGLLNPKAKKFSKFQFLRFQTSLYDSFADMWYVFYPKNNRLHEMYGYKSAWKTPFYLTVHALDLLGIRKHK